MMFSKIYIFAIEVLLSFIVITIEAKASDITSPYYSNINTTVTDLDSLKYVLDTLELSRHKIFKHYSDTNRYDGYYGNSTHRFNSLQTNNGQLFFVRTADIYENDRLFGIKKYKATGFYSSNEGDLNIGPGHVHGLELPYRDHVYNSIKTIQKKYYAEVDHMFGKSEFGYSFVKPDIGVLFTPISSNYQDSVIDPHYFLHRANGYEYPYVLYKERTNEDSIIIKEYYSEGTKSYKEENPGRKVWAPYLKKILDVDFFNDTPIIIYEDDSLNLYLLPITNNLNISSPTRFRTNGEFKYNRVIFEIDHLKLQRETNNKISTEIYDSRLINDTLKVSYDTVIDKSAMNILRFSRSKYLDYYYTHEGDIFSYFYNDTIRVFSFDDTLNKMSYRMALGHDNKIYLEKSYGIEITESIDKFIPEGYKVNSDIIRWDTSYTNYNLIKNLDELEDEIIDEDEIKQDNTMNQELKIVISDGVMTILNIQKNDENEELLLCDINGRQLLKTKLKEQITIQPELSSGFFIVYLVNHRKSFKLFYSP